MKGRRKTFWVYADDVEKCRELGLEASNDGVVHTSKKKHKFELFGDEDMRATVFRDQKARKERTSNAMEKYERDSEMGEWRGVQKKKARKVKTTVFSKAGPEEHLAQRLNDGRIQLQESGRGLEEREALISRVKMALQLNVVPKVVPCRLKQEESISARMLSRIREGTAEMIFVSGAPGTGKTLTVHRVLHNLATMKKTKSLPDFRVVCINCLNDLPAPRDVYSRLWMQLKEEKLSSQKAQLALGKRWFLEQGEGAPEYVILLLDELDALLGGTLQRGTDVLYTLLEWMVRPKSRLLVIGISNTINLAQRLKDQSAKTGSRIGPGAIHPFEFSAYTAEDIAEIIKARLRSASLREGEGVLPLFDEDALKLCAVKTASDRGDIRRALQVSLMAVEKMERSGQDRVTTAVVAACLRDLRSGPWSLAIANGSLFEKLFLWGVAQDFQVTGREDTTFHCVVQRLDGILPHVDLENPGRFVWDSVVSSLCASRVLVQDDKGNIGLPNAEGEYKTVDDIVFFLKDEHGQEDEFKTIANKLVL